MSNKKYKPEQIVTVLRQMKVQIANGKTAPQACKEAGNTRRSHPVLGYRPPVPGAYSSVWKPVSQPQDVM